MYADSLKCSTFKQAETCDILIKAVRRYFHKISVVSDIDIFCAGCLIPRLIHVKFSESVR